MNLYYGISYFGGTKKLLHVNTSFIKIAIPLYADSGPFNIKVCTYPIFHPYSCKDVVKTGNGKMKWEIENWKIGNERGIGNFLVASIQTYVH